MSQDLHAKEEKSVLGRVVTRGLLALACILVLMAGSCPGEAGGGGTVTGGPTSDGVAFDMWWGGPTGGEFTNDDYLVVGNQNDEHYWIILLRFDPGTIAEIPDGATITSANLVLTQYTSLPGDVSVEVDRITDDSWIEGSVTYSQAEPGTFVAGTPVNANISAGENSIDVTALVQAWVSGSANNGLRIKKDFIDTNNWIRFRATEYTTSSERPKLTIEY